MHYSIYCILSTLILCGCFSYDKQSYKNLLAGATRETSKELRKAKVDVESIETNSAVVRWRPQNKLKVIKKTSYIDDKGRFVFIPLHLPGISSVTSYLRNAE
jgi:hypothetical protein